MHLSPNAPSLDLAAHRSPRRTISRITHDINDHNYSIVMGSDLLVSYWEEISAHLAQTDRAADRETEEAFQELLADIPAVIDGIRRAARQIDLIVGQVAQDEECRRCLHPRKDD